MVATARRFSPIFTATVTPDSIDNRTGKTGPYAVLKGAKVESSTGKKQTITVMAFGKSHSLVSDKLEQGVPVDLTVQYDGPTLRVVGLPSAAPTNDTRVSNDTAKPRSTRKRETMLDACIAAAGFEEHRSYGS